MDEEIWMSIPGMEGRYDVSNLGCVRSWIKHAPSNTFLDKPKILKLAIHESGYRIVSVGPRNQVKQRKVHRLVLLAFVGPKPEDELTRHLDGNKDNNRLDNLKYGTLEENTEDSIKHGSIPIGSKNGQAKLNEEKVLRIIELYSTGNFFQKELAEEFEISQVVISKIVTGTSWAHVSGLINSNNRE